jgi:signal transduction histidine kinase
MEKIKILIVEDEGVLAKGLENRLKKLDYEAVGIASTGEEAIRQAQAKLPDLVLMDIKLKGEMDGIAAAQRIREHQDIPVIYLTAYNDRETLQRAKITEPYGYISKPVQERELHCNIEIALFKHKMEAEILKTRKLEAFSIFAEGIAHDFNNLLQIINGYIDVAMTRCDVADKICAEPLKKAEENLKQAGDLARKFLTVFKGKPISKKNIELHTHIANVIGKTPLPRNIEISYDFADSVKRASLNADEALLEEMFYHLLLNAIEAMADKERGAIKITSKEVELQSDNGFKLQEGRYVKISIKDEGRGIPRSIIGKVFDPYFSTKDNPTQKGLGLGLTACYSISRHHGGHIEVTSEEGKGTTVDVYLPALII